MPQREHPRIRRLRQDEREMQEQIGQGSDLINYRVIDQRPGMPPDKYEVTYHVRGVSNRNGSEIVMTNKHTVRVLLHDQYPQHAPGLKWSTPVWHPNIHHETHDVCINQGFWAPSRSLVSLVVMMGEMIQGRNVHYKNEPPYPLDNQAADWYQEYANRQGWQQWQPTDERPLLRPEGETPVPPPIAKPSLFKFKKSHSSDDTCASTPAPAAKQSSGGLFKFKKQDDSMPAESNSATSDDKPSGGLFKFKGKS